MSETASSICIKRHSAERLALSIIRNAEAESKETVGREFESAMVKRLTEIIITFTDLYSALDLMVKGPVDMESRKKAIDALKKAL